MHFDGDLLSEVCGQMNLGTWLWKSFGQEQDTFRAAAWHQGIAGLGRYQIWSFRATKGLDKLFSSPSIMKHIDSAQAVQSIPQSSLKSFYLDLWSFSFHESAKYGQSGRYPSNHQVQMHFQSFLQNGLQAEREAIDVKFNVSNQDPGLYRVHPFSVGYVDGQCKALIMQAIVAMTINLVRGSE